MSPARPATESFLPSAARPAVSDQAAAEAWVVGCVLSGRERLLEVQDTRPPTVEAPRLPRPPARTDAVAPKRGQPRVLVVCGPSDATADRFAAWLHSRGVLVAIASDATRLSLSLDAGRDGTAEVRLALDGEPLILRGAVVLGQPANTGPDFAGVERLAALWSALALIDAPVLNRPGRFGFRSRVDWLRLAWSTRPTIAPPDGRIGRAPVAPPDGRHLHVRRLSSGAWVHDGNAAQESDLYVSTWFGEALHLLIAGDRVFDLSRVDGVLSSALADWAAPAFAQLRAASVDLAVVVLEVTDGEPRWLDVNIAPRPYHFDRFEDAVFSALWRVLEP